MTFESDDARRAHFLERLRESLADPAFRQIEGFPIGSDEDIMRLSDPPYYTACPNPFLTDFIANYGKPYDEANDSYHREPFAADVSEGKNDPIYNAHSYHTKVPHKAIMRYILHYTEPGDIVFDGFCGTGMTGVAAQLCGDRNVFDSLRLQSTDRSINSDKQNVKSPDFGSRMAVLSDLSPAAAFIAANLNDASTISASFGKVEAALAEAERAWGWIYATAATSSQAKGTINYTVWADVFICSNCGAEVVFWKPGVNTIKNPIQPPTCQACGADTGKRNSVRAFESIYDFVERKPSRRVKRVPVLINVQLANGKRVDKEPDDSDRAVIAQVEQFDATLPYPTDALSKGERYYKDGLHLIELDRVDQFFTHRNLLALAAFLDVCERTGITKSGRFLVTSVLTKTASLMHNIGLKDGRINLAGALPNVLYIPSTIAERNIFTLLRGKLDDFRRAFHDAPTSSSRVSITTSDASRLRTIPDNAIDYIFVDPPFGSNLLYSELNELWESWLRVKTSNGPEAIVSKSQHKGLPEYQALMKNCFAEFHRILKPGRWMTVEFHNSRNSVWNAIQEALLTAGFMVASVRVLDKGQGTRNQMTQEGAVNKDLIISAYRPRAEFTQRFDREAGTEQGAWDFAAQHLAQLPTFVVINGKVEIIAERQNHLLYDRMIAFHIQRGATIPLNAAEFYAGLRQRFPERDGMYFLPQQVAEYDQQRLSIAEVEQLVLFVSDEQSTIQWLRQELGNQPQTYQDLHPKFLRELRQARHEELPELGDILDQNFLKDESDRWYVPNPAQQVDRERLREKALLRVFEEYKIGRGKLRQFRSEAVRAGFKAAWRERNYATIVQVARRLPEAMLQEDAQLLMYYDNAADRVDAP